ncbi:MAG: leucine-rich repeat domain-containing protein [Bacteroidia bacterium]
MKNKETSLNLSNMNLSKIPEMVFDLSHLHELKLMANNITIIPKEISRLTRLSHLYLSQNNIRKIPSGILKEMPFLECIDLGENPINYKVVNDIYAEQEKWIDYRRFVLELDELPINSEFIAFMGKIDEIPMKVFDFFDLKHLLISGQNLTEIPREIERFKNLRKLDLFDNKISSIPPELMQLSSLESINLSGNEFEVFPDEILKLPNIKSISFNNNNITHIKNSLDDIAFNNTITHFSFGENPLEDFDSNLFRGGISHIREVVYQIKY